MTEDSSSHWPIKRRYAYSETSRRAGLEFVCIFGHDAYFKRAEFWTWTPSPLLLELLSYVRADRLIRCQPTTLVSRSAPN